MKPRGASELTRAATATLIVDVTHFVRRTIFFAHPFIECSLFEGLPHLHILLRLSAFQDIMSVSAYLTEKGTFPQVE